MPRQTKIRKRFQKISWAYAVQESVAITVFSTVLFFCVENTLYRLLFGMTFEQSLVCREHALLPNLFIGFLGGCIPKNRLSPTSKRVLFGGVKFIINWVIYSIYPAALLARATKTVIATGIGIVLGNFFYSWFVPRFGFIARGLNYGEKWLWVKTRHKSHKKKQRKAVIS